MNEHSNGQMTVGQFVLRNLVSTYWTHTAHWLCYDRWKSNRMAVTDERSLILVSRTRQVSLVSTDPAYPSNSPPTRCVGFAFSFTILRDKQNLMNDPRIVHEFCFDDVKENVLDG